MMDRETIRKELKSLTEEGFLISCAIIMEYNKKVLNEPDKALQEITKESLPDVSREQLEKTLDTSLENVSEKKIQEVLKMGMQETFKDAYEKIKYPKETYQAWYDRASEIVSILRPKKLAEFEKFYTGNTDIKNDGDLNFLTAGTTHYLQGWSININSEKMDFFNKFIINFIAQKRILSAIYENLDNPLFNLERDIRHGIYESEMDIAKEFQEHGNLRMAGAIASLVIEVHLKNIAIKHGIPIKEKTEVSDYNNFLKRKGVCDSGLADQIRSCKKTRNKCIHTDKGDPSDGEISTIIHIADRVINEITESLIING